MIILNELSSVYNTLANDLHHAKAIPAEIAKLTKISKSTLFLSGLKNRFQTDRSALINEVATAAIYSLTIITPAVMCRHSFKSGDSLMGHVYAGLFAYILGTVIINKKTEVKRFAVETVLDEYYIRISKIIDENLVAIIGAQNSLRLKEEIKYITSNSTIQEIETRISNYFVNYETSKLAVQQKNEYSNIQGHLGSFSIEQQQKSSHSPLPSKSPLKEIPNE